MVIEAGFRAQTLKHRNESQKIVWTCLHVTGVLQGLPTSSTLPEIPSEIRPVAFPENAKNGLSITTPTVLLSNCHQDCA